MELITGILPHAVAVALSPMPIAALILLLLSNKAKINSTAFLLGWITALFINVGFFMLIFNKPLDTTNSGSSLVELFYLVIGILLVILAIKEWFSRPKRGEIAKMPKWMEKIVTLSPVQAFGIGFLLVTFNTKNTVIDIATGVQIGQKSNSFEESLFALAFYVLIASLTIFLPVISFLILGDKMQKMLGNLKNWFMQNNSAILFVLFLILGLNLISKAFSS